MIQVYHNTRCSKSRQALLLLQEQGADVEVIEYLKEPPTAATLKSLLQKLGLQPAQLLRKSESMYKEQFAGQDHTDSEWIDIMVKHPVLIERPIVVNGNQAVIGRPPEKVLTIL